MGVKVGINGFGRIGRLAYRAALEYNSDIDFVAVNRGNSETLAHLLRYDSVHGKLPYPVHVEGDTIIANGKSIQVLYESDPANLPWKDLEVFLAIESSGKFRDREGASKHLDAGASKVLISAPAKNPDFTAVMGVNDHLYDHEKHNIISNASCTTNCFAPIVKLLNDNFGIESGYMSTIHSYTTTQNILDKNHKDLRRARAAAANIIPTTTGAATATVEVLPELKGKLDAMAFRVPVPDVSLIDFTAVLKTNVTVDEINSTFKKASEGSMKNILGYSDEPLVSSDYIHDPRSSIIDGKSTKANGKLVKIISWYDNEWGYACRIINMAEKIGELAGY